MNQTDLPDPVKEDIAGLRAADTEIINRLLELEKELKILRSDCECDTDKKDKNEEK